MYSIGADLVSVDRIKRLYERHTDRFLKRLLTQRELSIFLRRRNQIQFLASRFAAKEALAKAIKLGVRSPFSFTLVEVLPNKLGTPEMSVYGGLKLLLNQKGLSDQPLVTLTDLPACALAVVVLKYTSHTRLAS